MNQKDYKEISEIIRNNIKYSVPFIVLFAAIGFITILGAPICEPYIETEPTETEQVYFYCEPNCLHIISETELTQINKVQK